MYKIGIIGHSPEHFSVPSPDEVQRKIANTIDLLESQYNTDLVVFNLFGDIGVGLWTAEECMKRANDNAQFNCAYHLFMPYTPEITSEGWFDNQIDTLNRCYKKARAITICNDAPNESLKQLINDSGFVVSFWVGKKQGKTFEAIKYALATNKMVLNGLDGLRMITNEDMRKPRNNR